MSEWGVQTLKQNLLLPQMSNFGSLPGKAGGLP